jgi:hypothetical protein
MEQARVAACRAFSLKCKQRVASPLPTGIYTIPEILAAGETEVSCKEKRIDYCIGRAHYKNNARGHITGYTVGMLKLFFNRSDRKLLGVSMIGESATELIHIGMMVLDNGLTIDEFIEGVFNYPTLSETYKYAARTAWVISPAINFAKAKRHYRNAWRPAASSFAPGQHTVDFPDASLVHRFPGAAAFHLRRVPRAARKIEASPSPIFLFGFRFE